MNRNQMIGAQSGEKSGYRLWLGRRWEMVLLFSLVCPGSTVAAPSVTSFSPTNGPPGAVVTVNGSGFSSAVLVEFDETPADFQLQSATRLLAVVPAMATVGPIRVSTGASIGDSGTRHFLPMPRLTGFSPARGAVSTIVVLEGENFVAVNSVRFADRAASFTVTAPTQINATVPAGVSNSVALTVETSAGVVVSSNPYTVIGPGPVVDGFTPSVGATGTVVNIEGANFTNITAVRFGGVPSASFSAPYPARITAVVPRTAVTGPITINSAAGSVVTASNFVVTFAPVITNFSPQLGKAGRTQVTIEGVNFTGIQGVGFNGRRGLDFSSPSPGRLTGTVPDGATTGRITVTNQYGFGISATDFALPQSPYIDSFQPDLGRPADPVTIYGLNLNGAVLRFHGTQATYRFNGQSSEFEVIGAVVPNGATTGPLSFSNSFGVFVTTSNYTVIGGAPFITGVAPGHGPRGSQVRIEGRNFIPPVSVFFNGVQDPGAFAGSPSQITATVPGTATTGPLVVATESGRHTNASVFHLPPRIASFNPASGPVGAEIQIQGANLAYAQQVEFEGAAASFTTNAADGSLRAIVPPDASTGLLRVVAPGGIILSATPFLVLPNITSFTPALGPNGTLVTILGTSFEGGAAVHFNNRLAASQVISSTEIQTSVPVAATTGRIRVTNPSGATITSSTDFRVTTSTDLRLTGTVSTTQVEPGDTVIFSFGITNRGLSPGTTVRLEQRMPAGLAHVSTDPSQGTVTFADQVVTCALGVVSNSAAAVVTTVAEAVAEGYWTNVATLTLAEGDQNVGDNTVRVAVVSISQASLTLQISKTLTPGNVVLVWPQSDLSLRPQFTEQLLSSNAWQIVPGSPMVISGLHRLTNTVPGPTRYYRLAEP